jgi:DNA-binding MarR family transcriptional regulator
MVLSMTKRGWRAGHPGHDLVSSRPDDADSRAVLVSPTPKGRRLAERISNILEGRPAT